METFFSEYGHVVYQIKLNEMYHKIQAHTGPLKKLFHYAIFQKFFSHFYFTFMVYVLQYALLKVYAVLFL